MTVFIVIIGLLICSIILTSVQMKLQNRKEINELTELFEEVPK